MIFRYSVLFACLLAICCGYFFASNPLLFGVSKLDGDNSSFGSPSAVFTAHPALDNELVKVKDQIGSDFVGYRNHCLRVLTFANYFIPDSVLQDYPDALDIMGVALAYHDVALWTDGKLNYIDPSIAKMEEIMGGNKDWSDRQMEAARLIIAYHHKVTLFSRSNDSGLNAMVESVRKADWTDFSMGVFRYGMPNTLLEETYKLLPEAGFHQTLGDMGPRLSPDSLLGQFEVLKIFRP